ncbi:UTP--glucose-1-phosphate uridylyltransferase GalU [Patescibacteria group bacterium]
MKKVRKAVIPVAGFGTRFLPQTKAMPKEMIPVMDKPVIQYIAEEAVNSGIEEIIFITSANKRAIEDHFDKSFELEYLLKKKEKIEELEQIKKIHNMAKFVYTRQSEPLGLGHAILCAKNIVGDEPFVACLGDDIVDGKAPACKQLIDIYEKYESPVVGVFEVPKNEVNKYGVIDPKKEFEDKAIECKGLVEKPEIQSAPSNLAIGGRYVFTPDIFQTLEQTKPGKGGEIQLTDAMQTLAKNRQFMAFKYDGIYHDCGNKLNYLKTVVKFALRDKDIGPELKKYIQEL